MKMLEKLLERKMKEGKQLDPASASAKMSVLQNLKDEMSGLMKDDLQNDHLKKVSVASNDEEGLKEGLDKAKEMISEESPDHEASESAEEEAAEHPEGYDEQVEMEMKKYKEDPSPENLQSLMACLERKKEEMK